MTIAKLYKGKTYDQLAKELSVSKDTIKRHIKKNGHLDSVGTRQGKNYKGKNYTAWAKELGVEVRVISYHMITHGHLDGMGTAQSYYKGKSYTEWAKELDVKKVRIEEHLARYETLDYIRMSFKELHESTKLKNQLKKHEETTEYMN